MVGKPSTCLLLGLWALLSVSQHSQAETAGLPPANGVSLKQQQSAIADLLGEAERRHGEAAAALFALQAQMAETERQMNAIRKEAKQLENTLEEQRKILAAELKAAYKMGRQGHLKLLLNQKDPALSTRMLRYYHYLLQERINTIEATQKLAAALAAKNQQIQQQNTKLAKLWTQKKNEQDTLAEAKAQRNTVLGGLAGLDRQEQLRQLKHGETVLKKLLDSLPDPDLIDAEAVAANTEAVAAMPTAVPRAAKFSALKGRLRWPAQGRVAYKFGSPRLETVWDGILIAAPEGTEVHAVADGKVVFANWLKGYGHLLILEHDSDYMTLYAFNQGLFKRKNETVHSGEVIAAVGQSGGRNQPGLYFSIRKHGVAIDPAPWWKK